MVGNSTYSAAKFAVEGLSEALRPELEALGVRIMLVEPGFFHTDFSTRSLKAARQAMAEYDPTPVGGIRRGEMPFQFTPNQPENLIALVMEALDASELPLRLVIGRDAMQMLEAKIASLQQTRDLCAKIPLNQE